MNDDDVTDVYADPAEVVRRFIADMHAWELEAAAAFRAFRKSTGDPEAWPAVKESMLASLARVVERWCTPKERPYGRNGAFGTPPEYQPEHEPVLETTYESPSRACVYTQRATGFMHKRMYVLQKKSNRWLIDNVKRKSGSSEWVKSTL